MTVTDELIANNDAFVASFPQRPAPDSGPTVAVVACMDHRMDIHAMLGLRPGQAQVIRNAGGIIAEDQIRSLSISQHLLGTEEIILIHHTDCGMQRFTDEQFKADLKAQTGVEPDWEPQAFTDLDADVRKSIGRILESPFIPRKHSVRGFVYDVETGRLREVTPGA